MFCDELDYSYPEEEYPCPEVDSPTLTREAFITTTNKHDLLTPDSGTYSPGEYSTPTKVPKSFSLQFPRVLRLPFSRSLNFCVFQQGGHHTTQHPSLTNTTSTVSVSTTTHNSILEEEEEEDYDWGKFIEGSSLTELLMKTGCKKNFSFLGSKNEEVKWRDSGSA